MTDRPHACVHADRALVVLQDSQYLAASERDDVAMNGTITSQNCRIQLQLTAATSHQEQYYSKAVNYTLLITALSFIQARAPLESVSFSPGAVVLKHALW